MQKNQQQNSNDKKEPVKEILTKQVVVCKKQLAARTRIEKAMLNEYFVKKEVLASSVPDAYTDIASLTNKYTSVTLLPEDIITPIRLMDEGTIPNLARAIPAGKRAISISVSKASSVGGFIQQGDYVDVIATFRPRNGDTISKIVLQDIQVLAMGNTYEFEAGIATSTPAIAASKAELITLALTPEDLEKLMYLDAGTTFRLVLKNPEDKNNVVQTRGATEQIVLKDIGHSSIPSEQNEQQVHNHNHNDNQRPSYEQEELDDGKVEIMFGSNRKREIQKYSGPANQKGYYISNTSSNSGIPTARIANTSED
jgi:pilus assembly protein CpaB